jgi:hypothetical protein
VKQIVFGSVTLLFVFVVFIRALFSLKPSSCLRHSCPCAAVRRGGVDEALRASTALACTVLSKALHLQKSLEALRCRFKVAVGAWLLVSTLRLALKFHGKKWFELFCGVG